MCGKARGRSNPRGSQSFRRDRPYTARSVTSQNSTPPLDSVRDLRGTPATSYLLYPGCCVVYRNTTNQGAAGMSPEWQSLIAIGCRGCSDSHPSPDHVTQNGNPCLPERPHRVPSILEKSHVALADQLLKNVRSL
ncbi:hypothetical protein BC628DRAFT_933089 [Trametes gibbosa]|nr:hypothetical protein BC628DRAFT_933089 [Trametes gibbosa]